MRNFTATQHVSCFLECWIQSPAHLIKLVEEESGLGVTLSVRLCFGSLRIYGAISPVSHCVARSVQLRYSCTFIIIALDLPPARFLLQERS